MSLELTEKKSNIGSGTLHDLVFILYCCVIGQWLSTCLVCDQSAISRRSVGERSATDWRSVGDWLATVSWAFVFYCRKSATFWRSVDNRSATGRRLKTVSGLSATAATGRRSVGDQSVLDSITVTSPQGHIVQGLVCTHGDGRSASAGRDTDRPCFLSQC